MTQGADGEEVGEEEYDYEKPKPKPKRKAKAKASPKKKGRGKKGNGTEVPGSSKKKASPKKKAGKTEKKKAEKTEKKAKKKASPKKKTCEEKKKKETPKKTPRTTQTKTAEGEGSPKKRKSRDSGKATFARRYEPTKTSSKIWWKALAKSFETHIKDCVTKPSSHEYAFWTFCGEKFEELPKDQLPKDQEFETYATLWAKEYANQASKSLSELVINQCPEIWSFMDVSLFPFFLS